MILIIFTEYYWIIGFIIISIIIASSQHHFHCIAPKSALVLMMGHKLNQQVVESGNSSRNMPVNMQLFQLLFACALLLGTEAFQGRFCTTFNVSLPYPHPLHFVFTPTCLSLPSHFPPRLISCRDRYEKSNPQASFHDA